MMIPRKQMVRYCFVLFLLVSSVMAGQTGPDLQEYSRHANSDEYVTVWIKLRPVLNSRQLKASISLQGTTRNQRHEQALSFLRQKRSEAQRDLLVRLHTLEASGAVRAIHPFWIVNVIEAQVRVERLADLVSRPDIEFIERPPEIRAINSQRGVAQLSAAGAGAAESNLIYIGADQAWAAGYTGRGRLICSFDTGVDGNQPGLKNNWKGLDGDSAAGWFDPIFQQSFPHTQSGNINHGTHVMGIMVGHNDATGDTVGVAPDAKWISAAVVDVGASAILRAFEWAADPDGNPNTSDDVPDVINHSWGFGRFAPNNWFIGCQNIFFDAIDATEAMGIVNIFAAGNSGSNTASIVNPANRDNDSLDCFAVGNLNHTVDSIVASSSRGPSDCSGNIKPNVVAPGYAIRSTLPGTAFGNMTGTSMAAPHVSGLVALLRQKNPNATVTEIKQAILTTTATHANFGTLPNNTYGWGRIDCMAALNALSGPQTALNVRVRDFSYPTVAPGDTVRGTVVAEAIGGDILNVSGTIIGTNPPLTVIAGTAFFGNMLHGDTVRSLDTIVIAVQDTVTPGQILSLDFQLSGTGWTDTTKLHVLVQPNRATSVVTHNTGRIQFSVSNFGVYGMGPNSFVPGPGVGFSWKGGINELYEAGLMIGTGFTRVSDAVHSYVFEPDNDFRVAPDGNMVFTSPGAVTFEQTVSAFTDSNATSPLGLRIVQETFADTGVNSDFVIIRYILQNISGASINGIYAGLFFNWDPATFFTQSVGGYDATDGFVWMAYYNGGAPIHYRGMKLLQGPLATALTQKASLLSLIPADGGNGFEKFEKFQALTDGFTTDSMYINTPDDFVQVMAAGPLFIVAGGADTIAFAILADSTFAEIQGAAARAQNVLVSVGTDNRVSSSLPVSLRLHQNYPNPFNPTTTISFDLARRSDYTLSVFNSLGQRVFRTSGRAPAGTVNFKWDAAGLASGVYLYRVEAGKETASRKLLLLK